jgi:RNA polymerase sigma-70 factor (ECF subfamily)
MMTQTETAEDILTRVADRDEAALADLYDRLAPNLLGLLLRILPDRNAAESVLEEVFLRLWVDARRWNKEQVSVAAALALLARAKAVERLRLERHHAAGHEDRVNPPPKFNSWLPRPQEIGLLDGRRDLFKKVINQLPGPQREALELMVFSGYTESEIAVKLNQPLARVRSGLLAGLGFIRHRLAAVMRTWAANI